MLCPREGTLRESSPPPAADRFSDVVSTSDDGDRYGMMPVPAVMGVGPVGAAAAEAALAGAGADAAYEMEDADDVVMDAGGLPHGPHGPLNPVLPPPLPLPPPRGVPPMVPHGPMPPHPGFQHQRRFSNGTYYDALPLRELEHHGHRHPPPPVHHHHAHMGRIGRGHPHFSSAASDTSSAAGFGPRGGGGGGYYGGRRTYREENDMWCEVG